MSKQKRRNYDSDFKRNAVLLSYEKGRVAVEVAENLGISKETLYGWRHEYRANGAIAFPGKGNETLTADQKRIKELEKQVRDAEMERYILKKAVAIFSKASK